MQQTVFHAAQRKCSFPQCQYGQTSPVAISRRFPFSLTETRSNPTCTRISCRPSLIPPGGFAFPSGARKFELSVQAYHYPSRHRVPARSYGDRGQAGKKSIGFERFWSGRPGSNRRRPAWEAGILPLNYARSGQGRRQLKCMEFTAGCQSMRGIWTIAN